MSKISSKSSDIQILRAIAIIAVVMIHTYPTSDMCQIFIRPFINFCVALFIFLSGYLTKLENSDWKSFCIKRINRVFIPYAIWTAIYGIVMGSVVNVPRNIITTGAAAPFYYIFVYIQLVLITPFLKRLAYSRYRNLGFLVSPIAMLIFTYPFVISGVEINRVIGKLWTLSCLHWFIFYYLGILLGNRLIKVPFSMKQLTIFLVLSILLQMVEGYAWKLLGATNIGTQTRLSSLITSCIFSLIAYQFLVEKRIKCNSPLWVRIGDYSFGIYLMHCLFIQLAQKYHIAAYNHLPFIVNTAVLILICSAICYLGNKLLPSKINRWLGFS